MTRYLMTQWRVPQWQAEEADGRSGSPLKHTASDAQQFAQLAPGDRVYVVGQRDRRMILIGRMDVGSVVSEAEADAYFGSPVYAAEHHVIASECSTCRFDRVVPEQIVRSLISERGAVVAFAASQSYELLSSSLQPRLWLTKASADALDRVLSHDPVLSDDAHDLLVMLDRPKSGGQGYGLNAAERRTVEERAEAVATRYFAGRGWDVENVSAHRSYDLECTRGADVLAVEVKGTTEPTIGAVLVTRNEVELTQVRRVDYAVVTAITLKRNTSQPEARGGNLTIYERLSAGTADLTPLAFSLKLPSRAGLLPR